MSIESPLRLESVFVSDILGYIGPDWKYHINEYGLPEFQNHTNKIPCIISRTKFEERFIGYTYNLFKVGGLGWIIRVFPLPGKR